MPLQDLISYSIESLTPLQIKEEVKGEGTNLIMNHSLL